MDLGEKECESGPKSDRACVIQSLGGESWHWLSIYPAPLNWGGGKEYSYDPCLANRKTEPQPGYRISHKEFGRNWDSPSGSSAFGGSPLSILPGQLQDHLSKDAWGMELSDFGVYLLPIQFRKAL